MLMELSAGWSYRVAMVRLIFSLPNIRSIKLRCLYSVRSYSIFTRRFALPGMTGSILRIPNAVFGWNILPRRTATKSPKYAVDDCTVLLRATAASPIDGFNRKQILQDTPFGFAQIASARNCLQKAVLNQASINTSTNSSTPPRCLIPACHGLVFV